MSFVNVRYYTNETKKGNASTAEVRRGVYYYGYGIREENPEQLPRGEWYSPHGWEKHGDVINWATGNARQHKYTYTILLSVKDGRMLDDDFTRAMQAGGVFADWRLITHTDTDHDHAHVITFRDETLSREQFDEWRGQVGDYLQQAEELRLQEAERLAEEQRRMTVIEQQQAEADLEWEL